MTAESQYARFGSGKSVRRVEDESLLTGAGHFADDASLPGQASVFFLRSPHPHARIAAIDTAAALAMPGVVAIITGDDLVRAGVKPLPLSADFKRGDGSPTASRAAARARRRHRALRRRGRGRGRRGKHRAQARDAAEAIDVRYEPLPAWSMPHDAVAPGAPLVWPAATGNIACEARHGDAAATAAAFAKAAHVVALDLVNQRARPVPDRAARDARELRRGDRPHHAARDLPDADGLARRAVRGGAGHSATTSVRVLVGDVGGGFGMKTALYPEDVVLAFGARELKRPVKWCAERMEEFLAARHGRDLRSKAELALDDDGRILALRVASLANLGAYATPAGVVIQLLIGPWVSTSIYDIRTIDIRIKAVLTHTAPTGAVPRRRAARGDLHHRAPDGRGGAQDRHRSASNCAGAT